MTLKVGIASFKHMHAESYFHCIKKIPGIELVAISEEDKSIQASHQGYTPVLHKTHEALTKDPSIEVVIVTSETSRHLEIALLALENGKHVIVEKPIATSLEEADSIIQAAQKNHQHLIQCYPCRYHSTAKILFEMVEAGQLGNILAISATNHGMMPDSSASSPYRWFSDKKLAGGGAVMDHTTHAADLIFWLTGSQIDQVYARIANYFHPDLDIDDAGMVTAKYTSGLIASIDPSWSRPTCFPTWGDLTMLVYGEQMTVTLDMFSQNLQVYSNSRGKASWVNFGTDADYLMLSDFFTSIQNDGPPPISGKDGKKALEVALLAYESGETGKPAKRS